MKSIEKYGTVYDETYKESYMTSAFGVAVLMVAAVVGAYATGADITGWPATFLLGVISMHLMIPVSGIVLNWLTEKIIAETVGNSEESVE